MKSLVFYLKITLFHQIWLNLGILVFKPGDSCINQLLSITNEIFQSFAEGFEVRSVFLDISKAFDKA